MKIHKLLFLFFSFLFSVNLTAQFSVEKYQQFLEQNKSLTSEQLLQLNSAGLFKNSINKNYSSAFYFDSLDIKYQLTDDEKSLLAKNGFVVTERLQEGSFGIQFEKIFQNDLPVFISSDAILHAVHASYDKILKNTELNILISKLDEIISGLKNNFSVLQSNNSSNSKLKVMLMDLDVYLSVAQKLLKNSTTPYYSENTNLIDELLSNIESQTFVNRTLFSESLRKIDFSQFKPRGHYTDDNYPQLANYFKTMMWFGKIELYLIAPKSFDTVPLADVQRQIIMSILFSELVDLSNQRQNFNEIESIIKTFVGDQDNVTLPDLEEVFQESNFTNPADLLDTNNVKSFQDVLKNKSYAGQKILSQILIHDPFSPDKVQPASAFMPFGQRFVIDSYITGNVVFDKVSKLRMLPSTLDILFALGNDASAQLLKNELDTYQYSSNLYALRYLIDSYDSDFWDNSIYNLWLNSIRSLNPQTDRTNLPAFMQTAAWWQQKMNGQLSSWTELRHDNLLYAKQSYTAGSTCSYPQSYVEPVPQFYASIKLLAESTKEKLNSLPSFDETTKLTFTNYFTNLSNVADTLSSIAQKELNDITFSESENKFLKNMLYINPDRICGAPSHIGWYPNLFFEDFGQAEFYKNDYLVADYHTAPTDEGGAYVGWVKHAGTGPIDLAILISKTPGNKETVFVGPVASYYEYTSSNFLRLTDEEWKESYLANESARPSWVNIYLANKEGNVKGEGLQLLTNVENVNSDKSIPANFITAQNYPNPFNPSTIIQFSVPQNFSNERTQLIIYNIQGEVVNKLVDDKLTSGTYMTRWNGDNKFGNKVSSGVYFYEVRIGANNYVGKMNLLK